MKKPVVLLFEDTQSNADAISKYLPESQAYSFHLFEADNEPTDQPFSDRIAQEIVKYGDIVLIVSDMDLSKTLKFQGLTDAIISRVAHDNGIPTAYYSSALDGAEGASLDQAGDGRILLGSINYEAIAHKIDILATGFLGLRESLKSLSSVPIEERPTSAAELVAHLIGKREVSDRIGLFLSGDQRIGAEVLASPKNNRLTHQTAIYGTWVYDSLMRYPGVFVNAVAASSYLNIALDDFLSSEISSVWNRAKYTGVFSDSREVLFWREELDVMLAEQNCDDGFEFVQKQGLNAKTCKCSVDQESDAGFYCMVTKQPVCFEHSVGDISWFPPGADLARITRASYEELAPWLGL
ncbi:hypothetical protein [Pseudomonas gingeri]|uniref:Uncharacterized protein n=1 Tax=Pseudomonas gingeri TaxID=117681 RepID=A0A7Y8BUJ6_9PSED|nr:hypothetical protein [Pseudomonas gingeri]NWB88414.1 hypothetical protein [Pseudomonas gingeri]